MIFHLFKIFRAVYVTFLSPNKKVTKEVGIGKALS